MKKKTFVFYGLHQKVTVRNCKTKEEALAKLKGAIEVNESLIWKIEEL